MRKNFKLLGAVAVAGLVAAGGFAFTAANTGVEDAIAGYQSAAVTGVTVTNVEYVVDETDASKFSSIVFTENQDVSAYHTATLTLGNGNSYTRFTCVTTTIGTITCDTATAGANVDITAVDSVALTVAQTTTPPTTSPPATTTTSTP